MSHYCCKSCGQEYDYCLCKTESAKESDVPVLEKQERSKMLDNLASAAMQGAIAGHFSYYGHETNFWPPDHLASYAYEVAEAMLEERLKRGV